jgi:WD40 repeat protein
VRSFAGHDHRSVTALAFSPDGTQLASGSTYGKDDLKVWDVVTGRELHAFSGGSHKVTCVAFSPDGSLLASAKGSTLIVREIAGGTVRVRAGDDEPAGVTSVGFSPDGAKLASGRTDKIVQIRDMASGRLERTLTGHSGQVSSLAFSPDGSVLATGSTDATARLWDPASGVAVRTLVHGNHVSAVAFSPDGTRLATGSTGTIKIWDVAAGSLLATLFPTRGGGRLITTPNGQTDGTPGEDGTQAVIYWQIGDVQLPGFVGWQREYTPGLFERIMTETGLTEVSDAPVEVGSR